MSTTNRRPMKPPGRRPTGEGRDARKDSGADKIRQAAIMYGTGSKQHKEAIRRFG